MHYLLYPTADTYISNKPAFKNKNVGQDELLSIGTTSSYSRVLYNTKTYTYSNNFIGGVPFENFTGIFTGSFFGITTGISGTIIGNNNRFTASYFSGSISGSVNGTETGSSFTSTNFSGSFIGYSGNVIAYYVNGYLSGSLTANCFNVFTGKLTGSVGTGSGTVTGTEIKNESYYYVSSRKYNERTLIKFDLNTVSSSISLGTIINPKFYLKLKSCEARELPATYKIYAFPVSQNWDQGVGYWSDGGSNDGVSWNYRDYYSGSSWWQTPYTETIITSSIDYLTNYDLVSESFKRGGGTWHNIICSQSFGYQVSDINMDVTTIVNSWLTGTVPNEGFILLYSGETNLTSSDVSMYFYSRQTNTIFSPTLDVAWDDQSWVTGSFGTGSVEIKTYIPILSGSITSPVTISDVIVSGSFYGTSYLIINSNSAITTGSTVDLIGITETVRGVSINGGILGTSSLSSGGTRFITASLTSGDFTGCELFGQYSSSMLTGFISGSVNQNLFLSHSISSTDVLNTRIKAYQYSPVSGSLMGYVASGSFHSGIFLGVITSGLFKGATVSIPFTGSYSYISSSFTTTSSVTITSSYLDPLNTNNSFVILLKDLKNEYNYGNLPKIRVYAREKFPLKTFGKAPQQPAYTTTKYLPTSSYYSIKDNETEEIIIDFDNYTKISCDAIGNYFNLDTTGLSQERYYKILLKVSNEHGNIYTFDNLGLFKIRR